MIFKECDEVYFQSMTEQFHFTLHALLGGGLLALALFYGNEIKQYDKKIAKLTDELAMHRHDFFVKDKPTGVEKVDMLFKANKEIAKLTQENIMLRTRIVELLEGEEQRNELSDSEKEKD